MEIIMQSVIYRKMSDLVVLFTCS